MFAHVLVLSYLLVGFTLSTPISDVSQTEIDYELFGGGFEGDMILPPEVLNPSEEPTGRGVAIAGPRQWPKNTIPYDISLITDQKDRDMIEAAMNTVTLVTGFTKPGESTITPCVTFRPKMSNEFQYLKIQYGTGCSATVGYTLFKKTLNLQKNGCFTPGIIQHELTHVLGFYHEQSRPDRDLYITINHENVAKGKGHNFNKYLWGGSVLNQNSTYDYD
ncbi:unnamed protein product, partial [Rotaria sordida]